METVLPIGMSKVPVHFAEEGVWQSNVEADSYKVWKCGTIVVEFANGAQGLLDHKIGPPFIPILKYSKSIKGKGLLGFTKRNQ